MAVKLIVKPVTPPPSEMLPLLAVVFNAITPLTAETARALVVVRALSLFTVKLAKVAPLDARSRVLAAESFVTVALPVVLSVNDVVAVFMEPMVPEPDVREMDVVPVTVLPVWDIDPEPLAETSTVTAFKFAPRLMAPLFAVVVKDKSPLESISFVVVMLLLFDTEKLVNLLGNVIPEVKLSA